MEAEARAAAASLQPIALIPTAATTTGPINTHNGVGHVPHASYSHPAAHLPPHAAHQAATHYHHLMAAAAAATSHLQMNPNASNPGTTIYHPPAVGFPVSLVRSLCSQGVSWLHVNLKNVLSHLKCTFFDMITGDRLLDIDTFSVSLFAFVSYLTCLTASSSSREA